jgi:hypothetical protein
LLFLTILLFIIFWGWNIKEGKRSHAPLTCRAGAGLFPSYKAGISKLPMIPPPSHVYCISFLGFV